MSEREVRPEDDEAERLLLAQAAAVLSGTRATLASLKLVLAELPGRTAALARMHVAAGIDNVEDAQKCLSRARAELR